MSFQLLFRVAHDILLAGAGWILLTVGSQVTLLIHPDILLELLEHNVRSPAFVALQLSFLLVSVLSVVLWAQDVSMRPPRPPEQAQTLRERLLTLISFPLMLVLALVFVALPTLQAQTRLMLGIPLQFRVTQKTRASGSQGATNGKDRIHRPGHHGRGDGAQPDESRT